MARVAHEHCVVNDIRREVEARLGLPPAPGQHETAAGFWSRVERAGRLQEALALYDQVAAEWRAWEQVPRETKRAFFERVGREGRVAEVERELADLLASGLSRREAQTELVERFQPLDGTETRAWKTPDPWQAGRLFRRKADQAALVALADCEDEELVRREEAEGRVTWARFRREEGLALATARWRLRRIKADAQDAERSPVGTSEQGALVASCSPAARSRA